MSYVVVSRHTQPIPISWPVPSEEILRKVLEMFRKRFPVVVSSCSGDDEKKILHFTGALYTNLVERELGMHTRPRHPKAHWGFEWHLDDN
jgi:hypothetical protein